MNHPSGVTSIQTYDLYGEADNLPDVVHIEAIETRSMLHDWSIGTHRHGRLHQVLFIEGGGGMADLEGRKYVLGALQAVNVPIGMVHGFDFTPGTKGFVITLASEIYDAALEASLPLRAVLARPGVFQSSAQMRQITTQLIAEFEGREFARAQVLLSLSGALLGLVARLHMRAGLAVATSHAARHQEFVTLLEMHVSARWSVSDYAREMGITPVHLNRIAQAANGKSASALIDETMVREARRNLVYTNLPISRIAYLLGFSDPAYFSRVFTRTVGISPRAVRALVSRG